MTLWLRWLRIPIALACGWVIFATTADAQTTPAWTERLPADVEAFSFAPTGAVLVQLKTGLFAAEPETGAHVWSRPGVRAYSLVAGTPFAIFTTAAGMTVAGVESGKDRWSFASLGFSSIKGMVHLPAVDLLLVYGVTPQSAHTLIACRYGSGERVWTQTTLYADPALASKASKVEYRTWMLDGESSVVLDPSHDGLIRLDLKTGQPIWRLPEPALVSKGSPLEMVAVGRVMLGFYDSGDRVLGISLDEGKVLWTRKERFPTPVFQVASTPAGTLIRGAFAVSNGGAATSWRPYLTLIDPETGATKWMLQKDAFKGRSAFLLEENTLLEAAPEAIVSYDAATGAELNTVKMTEFSGNEYPALLDRDEDGGLLVWSSQNLRKFDRSGALVYSLYLKAPGSSFLAKLGSIALAVAMSAAVGAATSAIVPGAPYYPVYMPEIGSPLTARFKATTNARRYMYMFTEEPGGEEARFALVRIDKFTGKDTGRIRFNERAPSFRLDWPTGAVVVEHDGTLAGYRFPPTEK